MTRSAVSVSGSRMRSNWDESCPERQSVFNAIKSRGNELENFGSSLANLSPAVGERFADPARYSCDRPAFPLPTS